MQITLHYAPIACSLVPYVALTEAGAEFDVSVVNFLQGEHMSPDYLALNPKHKVPVLVVDGEPLTGEAVWPKSLALLVYMAREPGPGGAARRGAPAGGSALCPPRRRRAPVRRHPGSDGSQPAARDRPAGRGRAGLGRLARAPRGALPHRAPARGGGRRGADRRVHRGAEPALGRFSRSLKALRARPARSPACKSGKP